MSRIYLNDIWAFYYHDPYNPDWTYKSYIKLEDVSSVCDFWSVYNSITNNLSEHMFFVMREHIFPCWDDENNVNGGCFTIKIIKNKAVKFWEEITIKLLGETLLKPAFTNLWESINGVSISPKKSFCIVKIWMKNNDNKDPAIFDLPNNGYGEVLYKCNKEMIANDIKTT